MTTWRAALPIALATLISACASERSPVTYTESDSAGVRIVTSTGPAEEWTVPAQPELSIGADAPDGPEQFFQVWAMVFLPGDRFAVADGGTQEIRLFTTTGDFLGKIGRKGNGPEEFSFLDWMAVAGDSLIVYDGRNDRISVWTAGGDFARSFRLEWLAGRLVPVASLGDRSILAVTVRGMTEMPHDGLVVDSALVSRYDAAGVFLDSLSRMPHNQRVVHSTESGQTVLALPFSVFAALVPAPDGFCHAFGTVAEVRCADYAGVTRLVIRMPLAPRPVRPEHRDWFWDEGLEANPNSAPFLRRARDYMVFPDHFPAFADLLADDAGRIWARVYPLPGETPLEWRVFEDGRWVGRLRADASFRVRAVAGDRLLGVWRDEMGVESVRLYRFRSPAAPAAPPAP